MIIKSKRFILRPYKKEDEISLQRNINDKTINKNIITIPYPYTIKDARLWIRKCKKLQKYKSKKSYYFAIDVKGEVVGGIGIDKIKNKEGELGYWIGKNFRNEGIATKAAKLIVDYGFKKIKLRSIYARAYLTNKFSIRVMQKLKFKFERLKTSSYLNDNRKVVVYRRTK